MCECVTGMQGEKARKTKEKEHNETKNVMLGNAQPKNCSQPP